MASPESHVEANNDQSEDGNAAPIDVPTRAPDQTHSDTDSRRHSLPLNFFLPNIWGVTTPRNSSTVTLAEPRVSTAESAGELITRRPVSITGGAPVSSVSAAGSVEATPDDSGRTSLDSNTKETHSLRDQAHATIFAGSAARYHLDSTHRRGGTSRGRHRKSKSAVVGNTVTDQPVVVRTYTSRPSSRNPTGRPPTISEEGAAGVSMTGRDVKLPGVEAWGFEGILRAVEPELSHTIDAVAHFCEAYRQTYEPVSPSYDLKSKINHNEPHNSDATVQRELDTVSDSAIEAAKARERENVFCGSRSGSIKTTTPHRSDKGGSGDEAVVKELERHATRAQTALENIAKTLNAIDELVPGDNKRKAEKEKDGSSGPHSLLAERLREAEAEAEAQDKAEMAARASTLMRSKTDGEGVKRDARESPPPRSWRPAAHGRSKSLTLSFFAGSGSSSAEGKAAGNKELTGKEGMMPLRTVAPGPEAMSMADPRRWDLLWPSTTTEQILEEEEAEAGNEPLGGPRTRSQTMKDRGNARRSSLLGSLTEWWRGGSATTDDIRVVEPIGKVQTGNDTRVLDNAEDGKKAEKSLRGLLSGYVASASAKGKGVDRG